MAARFQEASPVFPVQNVAKALEHYRRLGFAVQAYGEGDPSDPAGNLLRVGPNRRAHRQVPRMPDPYDR